MRLAAVMLLFKEEAFVEASVRAIYPLVDSICCASQYDRTMSGREVAPDQSLNVLLRVPDPENKIRVVVQRDVSRLPGANDEARLRNAARALDPEADYYLILDSDEIWPKEVLRQCRDEVERTQWAGYRISCHTYFKTWNHRIVEPGTGCRPLVFVRNGFPFEEDRQIQWHSPARWKEYARKGRKPKTVYFAPELRLHHGSSVGDDARILTKIQNWGHRTAVYPDWFDRVWKNFDPAMRNFHYFAAAPHYYESLITIPTPDLPDEIAGSAWPEGWIAR